MAAGLADKLDIVISLVAGVVATLYGFGVIGKPQGGSPSARGAQFLKLAKWLGPLLIVISAVRLLAAR